MFTRLIAFALLLTSSLLLAACGSSESKDSSNATGSAANGAKQSSSATTPTDRTDRAQAATATSGAGFADCIDALGFASMPPGHGVAAQWKEPKTGAILAISSDDATAATATVAAQFSKGDQPATEVGDGIVVSGGAPAGLVQDITKCGLLR